ncbi:MAG TPA: DUF1778 domain-containing protein [Silvibacterium sp.]|nr:DUF1778 domain-containing protein [Silvibacterium sp.]
MIGAKSAKKSARDTTDRSRTELRYAHPEHHHLVMQAAKAEGQSINAWLVRVTLAAAKKTVNGSTEPESVTPKNVGLLERIDRMEETLLREFRKSPLRMLALEERVGDLERRNG